MLKSNFSAIELMHSNSLSSFVNGLIAGSGAVLAIMSVAFLQMLSPLEGAMGITTTETRVGILLGGLVCAAAIGYEFYSRKETKKATNKS